MKAKTKPKDKIVSISQYAELCGVSKTVIYTRIEAGEVVAHKDKSFIGYLINATLYPPTPKKKNGRKQFSGL